MWENAGGRVYFCQAMNSSVTTRIQLDYRPDLRLLTGRWLTDATLPEFRAEYAAVLAAAQAHQAWHWLLDVRRRPLPPAGAVEWLNNVWMPAAAEIMPRHLCIAYLVSPQRLQTIAANDRLQTAVQHLEHGREGLDVGLFNDEGEAMRWLSGQQARHAELPEQGAA